MISKKLRISSLLVVLCLVYPGGGYSLQRSNLQSSAPAKSIEAYWAETDLSEEDLLRFLSDEQCLNSERQFLACVNALSSMAERSKLRLTREGRLEELSAMDVERRLTEKNDLESWRTSFEGPEFSPSFSFTDVWRELKSKVESPAKTKALIATGINAYFSVARDPHTYIVPLAYYDEVLSQSESRSPHLGFVARRVRGAAIVRKVFSSSPAGRAGLKKGDRIIELNGEQVSQLHSAEFNELIRGQSAGRLLVTIQRLESNKWKTQKIEILQGETQLISVESRVLSQPNRVGLLTIHKFARETCQMARQQLVGLLEQGIQGLIVDLRDNPGGQVDEAACIAGLFLEPGASIFHTKYLDATKLGEMYWAEGPQLYTGPLAILINSGSASAAEIVAGALKDLGRATLVGERSFGKGSFQDGMMWRANSNIALFQTQGFYYFASGWTPQIVGLEPDIQVSVQGSEESLREQDLYLVPLRPMDLWTGPQSLTWAPGQSCGEGADANAIFAMGEEDLQIQRASDWVRCREVHRTGGL